MSQPSWPSSSRKRAKPESKRSSNTPSSTPPIEPSVTTDYDPYSDLPKNVRIGYCSFKIEVPNGFDFRGEFGHTNIVGQVIRLAQGQNNQALANTFLHEVLHAIHWDRGLWPDEEDNNEEKYTNMGANGLCLFIQDNPEAWAWFMKNNTKERK